MWKRAGLRGGGSVAVRIFPLWTCPPWCQATGPAGRTSEGRRTGLLRSRRRPGARSRAFEFDAAAHRLAVDGAGERGLDLRPLDVVRDREVDLLLLHGA